MLCCPEGLLMLLSNIKGKQLAWLLRMHSLIHRQPLS
jgi:hypothetical protein